MSSSGSEEEDSGSEIAESSESEEVEEDDDESEEEETEEEEEEASSSSDDDDEEERHKGRVGGASKDAVGWLMDSFRADIDEEKKKWAKLQARQDREIAEMQAELDAAKLRTAKEAEKQRRREEQDEAQRKRVEQAAIERRDREIAAAIAEAARPTAASMLRSVGRMVAADLGSYGSQLSEAASAASAALQSVDLAGQIVGLGDRGGAKLAELRRLSALRLALLSKGVTQLPVWLRANLRPPPPKEKTGVPTKRQAAAAAADGGASSPSPTPRRRAEQSKKRVFVGGGLVEQPVRQLPKHKPPPVPPPAKPVPAATPVPTTPKAAVPPPPPAAAKPARPTKALPASPTAKPETPTKALPPPPPSAPKPAPPTSPKPAPPTTPKPAAPSPRPVAPKKEEPPVDISKLGVSAVVEDLSMPAPRPASTRRAFSVQLTRTQPQALPQRRKVGMRRVPSGAVVVLDNGSSMIKVGVAGEDVPRSVIPSVCGYVGDSAYVGRPALLKEGLKAACPIDPRRETDWDALADVWEYCLSYEMRVDPAEHPLLMTEVPTMCEAARSKMAEILFESFEVPALHIANTAVLSLYAQGLVTGLAVDIGNRMQIVPVVDGFVIDAAVSKTRIGVAGLTEYLARIMAGRGYRYFGNNRQLEGVRKCKEALCYVALDYAAESAKPEKDVEASYLMPDGVTVTLGSERFQAPEAMFAPEMLGLDLVGLDKLVWRALTKSPIDCRKQLLSSVVVSGGSTLFPGFAQRLEKELFANAQGAGFSLRKSEVRVLAPGNRKYLAWVGGAVLGSVGDFVESSCLSREHYFEDGSV